MANFVRGRGDYMGVAGNLNDGAPIPEKVKSLDFLKIAKHRGVLTGIKGQYLLFKDNTVINIRKHGGFFITIQA